MLEVARIFSTRSFDSTIRFIGFDLEESGLIGSTAYAQNAAATGDNIALATIFEMIGYPGPTQSLHPTGDAGPFGSFTVSEKRTVGDFIGTLAANVNDPQLLADYVNGGIVSRKRAVPREALELRFQKTWRIRHAVWTISRQKRAISARRCVPVRTSLEPCRP